MSPRARARLSFLRTAAASAGLCVLLSGCLLPDRFDATLTLATDRATLDYDGELVATAVFIDATAGKLTPDETEKATREALAPAVEDVRRDSGTLDLTLLGEGRARAKVHWTQPTPAAGAKTTFADLVAIRRQGDGTLEIASPELKERDRTQLARMGLGGASGRLCIRTSGQVVDSNATTRPAEPGGCHVWTVTVLKDAPIRMLVRF